MVLCCFEFRSLKKTSVRINIMKKYALEGELVEQIKYSLNVGILRHRWYFNLPFDSSNNCSKDGKKSYTFG
jgi:hypothetical protein